MWIRLIVIAAAILGVLSLGEHGFDAVPARAKATIGRWFGRAMRACGVVALVGLLWIWVVVLLALYR
jgi:hypothetical protein